MRLFDGNDTSPNPANKFQKFEIKREMGCVFLQLIETDRDTGEKDVRAFKFDADSGFLEWLVTSLSEALRKEWKYP